ncbi:phosphonate metabolism protein/1,5-bisphosphokinase (PRPP-forming) PhnN [Shimia biformata]|uniref:phosphonate metabolism protein/1,5-bisphosphokinase (PRPP-forming) PhnN n=1 Tax=Shimia biformata TaxID=1294299 RepID=UPI001951A570|nr:phosphonate metabolism protein/1,5-bisphosphokinase (PRPP-forming) PhnN [Shimia biformata]
MRGRILAVVGPSGVGKDTVMAAVAARLPSVTLARRTITRPETAGGEAFEGVTKPEFEDRLARGSFALCWQAHGLHYGIGLDQFAPAQAGGTVLFNGSRAALAQAVATFPTLQVLHIIARPEVLAERLAGRGRESADQIANRLSRRTAPFPDGVPVHEIDNSGRLEDAVSAILVRLQPESV